MASTSLVQNTKTAQIWSNLLMREALKSTLFKKFIGPLYISVQGKWNDKRGIMVEHGNGKRIMGGKKREDNQIIFKRSIS